MTDFVAIALDAADSIARGIPSAIVAGELARKYDVELASLQRMINSLEQEINNNPQMDKATMRAYLADRARSYSPLGLAAAKFNESYAKADTSAYDKKVSKYNELLDARADLQYQRDRPRGLSAGIRGLVGTDELEVSK